MEEILYNATNFMLNYKIVEECTGFWYFVHIRFVELQSFVILPAFKLFCPSIKLVYCFGERFGDTETKINIDQTKEYILTLTLILAHMYSHTRTHTIHKQNRPVAFCLSCGAYKQEVDCLSFLGSVNILNKNKFLPSEKGESHTVEAAGLSLRCLWCPSERADNEGLLHLNSFNWRVDVTGCWYFLVIILA